MVRAAFTLLCAANKQNQFHERPKKYANQFKDNGLARLLLTLMVLLCKMQMLHKR